MTRVITFKNPEDIGFDLFDTWPYDDQSVASVAIENLIMAALPHGNLFKSEPDPFVHIMQEAQRVLEDGGTLEVKAPYAGGHLGIGHPLMQRVYTETTWYAFGCPEFMQETRQVINDETGDVTIESFDKPIIPKNYHWGTWLGVDLGVRFGVIHCAHDDSEWTAFYRKLSKEELE